MIGLCPRCRSAVLQGGNGYSCIKCGFKFAGVILGQQLDPTQAAKLLREGRTDLLSNFVSKQGRKFSALLVLDQTGKLAFEFPDLDPEQEIESQRSPPTRKQRDGDDCKPLIEVATKDLFRKNAFRITGLPVDASAREVAKHADKLKILAELGQEPHTEAAVLPIKPPPTLDEIREAIQKLKDPEKRLIDEFFWFWPEVFGNSQTEAEFQALARGDLQAASEIWKSKEDHPSAGVAAKHNLALVFHIAALDWEKHALENEVEEERRQKISDYWKEAFSRWEQLATNDQFWEKVGARIRQLNEPNLPTGFARRMRATLPEALDKINAELAVSFAQAGKIDLARMHIRFMRETNQGLDNVDKTAELVLAPARNRLKEQIRRAKERADKDPRDAANAARELLDQARHTLHLFDLFFEKESDSRSELFDEVAGLCNQLPVAYQKATGDDKTCLEILKSVLPFATSIELRQQIEKNIDTLSGNLAFKKLEPVYALFKTIQESKESPRARLEEFNRAAITAINVAALGLLRGSDPRNQLFDSAAIVLRGISLDAWNKFQDKGTATAANKIAAEYAVSSELRQRLVQDSYDLRAIPDPSATELFGRKVGQKLGPMGCLSIVAIVIVVAILGSCDSTRTSSSDSSYAPPAYTPSHTEGNGASDGSVYRVPTSASSTLNGEKAELEAERVRLEALEAQIERLGREIERDRLHLDRTSRYSVQAFNEKVDRYNELTQRAKMANAAFNGKVDSYNAKVRQYGR